MEGIERPDCVLLFSDGEEIPSRSPPTQIFVGALRIVKDFKSDRITE
jgi:hypothetical protein